MKKDCKTKLVQSFFILILAGIVCSISVNAQTKENKNWTGTYTFTDSAQASKRRNA